MLRGKAIASAITATSFFGLTAQGAGTFIYITGIQCLRLDTAPTAIVSIVFNDTIGTVIGVPTTGVVSVEYGRVPLLVPVNTGLTMSLSIAVPSGVICSAQGYRG